MGEASTTLPARRAWAPLRSILGDGLRAPSRRMWPSGGPSTGPVASTPGTWAPGPPGPGPAAPETGQMWDRGGYRPHSRADFQELRGRSTKARLRAPKIAPGAAGGQGWAADLSAQASVQAQLSARPPTHRRGSRPLRAQLSPGPSKGPHPACPTLPLGWTWATHL